MISKTPLQRYWEGVRPMAAKMKQSGIEWIGEIPEGWTVKKMRFLGVLNSSGVDKKIREGEPCFKAVHYNDVYNNSLSEIGNREEYLTVSANDTKKGNLLNKGDVLFTTSSEIPEDIGHSTVVKEDLDNTLFGYHLMRLRDNGAIALHYKKYLFGNYYIKSWFGFRAKGITRYGITYIDFADAVILIPPYDIQERIANFLDKKCAEIDKVISSKEKQNELLKEQRQSIIYEAVTKGLDKNVKYKDSGIEWIGKIPEGWGVCQNKRLFSIKSGEFLSSDRQGDTNDYPIIGGNGVLGYTGNFNSDNSTLVLGRVGALCGNVHFIKQKAWITDNALQLFNISKDILVQYLYFSLQAVKLNQYASMTAQPLITGSLIKNIYIPLPDTFIQQEIVNYIQKKLSRIDRIIESNNSIIEKLKEYRQSIIYEAVTGKIVV